MRFLSKNQIPVVSAGTMCPASGYTDIPGRRDTLPIASRDVEDILSDYDPLAPAEAAYL
jgi:hypothetical protein